MCETKIKNIFQEKLEIHEDLIIKHTHRTKEKTIGHEHKDKSMILRKAHELIFINEDFSKQITDLRKDLWKEVKQLLLEDKIAYCYYRTVVNKRRNNKG